MKKPATETTPRPSAEEKTENKQVLRLKKRPLVSLTDDQMGDAAGGHPHPPTCDATCPRTCPRTCGLTCGDTCHPTCDACESYDMCSEVC